MDIYCPQCGEPWDNDELHESDLGYRAAYRKFFAAGCGSVFDVTCTPRATDTGAISAAMYDLLGDDVDGIAAMMQDAGF